MDFKTLLFIIAAVLALDSVVGSAFADTGCGAPLKQVYYSAAFSWNNPGNQPENRKMWIRIGASAQGQARPVAQIMTAQGECQAVCYATSLDKSGPTSPLSMDLSCRGAQLGALTTPVTLSWAARPGTFPTLRFGSWLNGYQTAALTVEYDQYSQPPHRTPALALTK